MKPNEGSNPFTPGTGHSPPLLAGRSEETAMLTLMLNRLRNLRSKKQHELARQPFPPIKIIGPRGVGKTVLLAWAEKTAQKRQILVIRSAHLEDDGTGDPMQSILEAMKSWPTKVLERFQEFGVTLPGGAGVNVATNPTESTYDRLLTGILQKRPLLLLLDEVQHFDLRPLRKMLQVNQQLVSRGLPLGVVLAGTPGLDRHIRKARSTFITRSDKIYINTLSDEATREALTFPFDKMGVNLDPDALEEMVAQTDNYPYFIQLLGREVWRTMCRAGRDAVDIEIVKQSQEKAREGRVEIYEEAFERIADSKLLPQARQVMEALDRNGGEMGQEELIGELVEANADVDDERAREICASLREDGFIWTVRGRTSPGIPSFFNYCKAKLPKKKAS